MSNLTTNYTTFIGSKETIDTIYSYCNTEQDVFDFNKLVPIPEPLHTTAWPVTIISDEDFKEKHGIVPKTKEEVEDFLISYKKQEEQVNKRVFNLLNNITKSISTVLFDEYNSDNWYDWTIDNWGGKWDGYNIYIHYKSDNIFLVQYDISQDIPNEIFDILENEFEDLTIYNLSRFNDKSTEIVETRGDDEVNGVYWTITKDTELDTYGLHTGHGIAGILTNQCERCQPNEDNLNIMEKYDIFIDNAGNPNFFPIA